MAATPSAVECIKNDIEFHKLLITLTGNKILQSMIPLTVDFFEKGISQRKNSQAKLPTEHAETVAAVKAGDAAKLRSAISKHYQSYKAPQKIVL
ncbi:MAG: FCD domain-containing protein [Lentisphaerae bacterium]|nr:FCD domain-containing protein [Lentisphaerota bacterium]MCP4101041.1 FCD domain-containing protein [Lentisphaerota bacterium]